MNVSIHQPNYLPWLGFFNKVAQSDIYVVFDDVQYPMGKDFHNRNQIKTNNGKTWLTIPVVGKSERRKFNEIQIKDNGWNEKHLNNINTTYMDHGYERLRDMLLVNKDMPWFSNWSNFKVLILLPSNLY